jgi:hypothetical protein
MQLRAGYELIYSFPQPTPIILVVNIHYSRTPDIVVPDRLITEPFIPITANRDAFGNCTTQDCRPLPKYISTLALTVRRSSPILRAASS